MLSLIREEFSVAAARKVLLVSMPFGTVTMPSLGLSLLKAALAHSKVTAEIRYLGIEFARRLGLASYDLIVKRDQSSLIGEWVFQPSLYGRLSAERIEAYWRVAYPDKKPRRSLRDESLDLIMATACRAQGEATRFIDDIASTTDWTQYRIVGFSTTFHQSVASLALAQRIKRHCPDTKIVFGGANCEAEMGLALLRNYAFIDCVFSGEADETFPSYAKAVLDGRSLKARAGVLTRDLVGGSPVPRGWVSPVTDLDALPYPDFDDFFEQVEPLIRELPVKRGLAIPFETSRGCWWGMKQHCTFCGLNGMTMAYRSKSAARALAEVRWLQGRWGNHVEMMQAVDNILDLHYFDSVIPALAEHDGPRFFYEVKSNLSREQVVALANARVDELQPGIESLDTSVLKLMRKGCTALQNIQLLKWCAELGMHPGWNLIYGFPDEEKAAYARMARLIPLLRHLQPPVGCGRIRLDRFSPFFRAPENFGMVNLQPSPVYEQVFQLPADQIFDLAYYFEFDYADRRDLTYTRKLMDECDEWLNDGGGATLVGFDDGDELLVYDTRPIARAQWISLRGLHRAIALGCDAVTSLWALARQLNRPRAVMREVGEIETGVCDLEEAGLVVREGDRLLSLVVLVRDTAAPAPPRQNIIEPFAKTSDKAVDKHLESGKGKRHGRGFAHP
jgi:ribosomal peptide maturation radical SAM protein 1